MRRSMIREMIITAALSLTMSVSLSYGAVLAIDHWLGAAEETALPAIDAPYVDPD